MTTRSSDTTIVSTVLPALTYSPRAICFRSFGRRKRPASFGSGGSASWHALREGCAAKHRRARALAGRGLFANSETSLDVVCYPRASQPSGNCGDYVVRPPPIFFFGLHFKKSTKSSFGARREVSLAFPILDTSLAVQPGYVLALLGPWGIAKHVTGSVVACVNPGDTTQHHHLPNNTASVLYFDCNFRGNTVAPCTLLTDTFLAEGAARDALSFNDPIGWLASCAV
jgi:hypothetical protein